MSGDGATFQYATLPPYSLNIVFETIVFVPTGGARAQLVTLCIIDCDLALFIFPLDIYSSLCSDALFD